MASRYKQRVARASLQLHTAGKFDQHFLAGSAPLGIG